MQIFEDLRVKVYGLSAIPIQSTYQSRVHDGFISYFHYVITPCATRMTSTTSAASTLAPTLHPLPIFHSM